MAVENKEITLKRSGQKVCCVKITHRGSVQYIVCDAISRIEPFRTDIVNVERRPAEDVDGKQSNEYPDKIHE